MNEVRSPLRVGLCGAGWVTQYHLPAWQKHQERAQVVAIADPSSAARQARAEAFGIAATYGSLEEMLEGEDLDIIDICSPVEAHAPQVLLAAERGLAVLCQKPLARDHSEAEALVARLGAARVMVHDNWRFRATYRRLKEWLEAGVAGTIRRVQLDYVSSGMIAGADGQRPALVRQPNFRTLVPLLTAEVLVHQLDTLRYLLGELDVVTAHMARSNDEIAAEDIATITLRRRSDGVPVLLAGNLAQPGEPEQARDQLRIIGSDATITLDGFRISARGATEMVEDFDPAATYEGSYAAAIGHFLDGLASGAPFETAPTDNLRTAALVAAAYAAAARRGEGETAL